MPFPRDSCVYSTRLFLFPTVRIVLGVRPGFLVGTGSLPENLFAIFIFGAWRHPTVVLKGAGNNLIRMDQVFAAQVRRVRFGNPGGDVRLANTAGGILRMFNVPVPFGPLLSSLARELPAATMCQPR